MFGNVKNLIELKKQTDLVRSYLIDISDSSKYTKVLFEPRVKSLSQDVVR